MKILKFGTLQLDDGGNLYLKGFSVILSTPEEAHLSEPELAGAITREVIATLERHLAEGPGEMRNTTRKYICAEPEKQQ